MGKKLEYRAILLILPTKRRELADCWSTNKKGSNFEGTLVVFIRVNRNGEKSS